MNFCQNASNHLESNKNEALQLWRSSAHARLSKMSSRHHFTLSDICVRLSQLAGEFVCKGQKVSRDATVTFDHNVLISPTFPSKPSWDTSWSRTGQADVALTFDHPNHSSPSGCLCNIGRNSLKAFQRMDRTDNPKACCFWNNIQIRWFPWSLQSSLYYYTNSTGTARLEYGREWLVTRLVCIQYALSIISFIRLVILCLLLCYQQPIGHINAIQKAIFCRLRKRHSMQDYEVSVGLQKRTLWTEDMLCEVIWNVIYGEKHFLHWV